MTRLIFTFAFVFLIGLSSMLPGFTANAYSDDSALITEPGSYQTISWHHRHWHHHHWHPYGYYGYYDPYYPYGYYYEPGFSVYIR